MRIRSELRSLAAFLAVAVLLVGGCGSGGRSGEGSASTSAAPPAGWPAALDDFTMVWTAEPGIDVTAWPAVVVRAYTESFVLASIMNDDKYLYPGFRQSVDPNKSIDDPIGTQYLWPRKYYPQRPWVGTQREHILSVTASGRDITVIVCEYTFGAASEGRFGRRYAPRAVGPDPYKGIESLRITMTAPAKPVLPLPAQQGPARAPSVDVFAGWRITSHQGGWFARSGVGSDWPHVIEDQDTCLAKAPPHPDFVSGEEYDRSLFPTLPASPGWPSVSANA
ncbi:hypothetical protein DSM43518_05008 [Mycobacterium marinum]|uniref:hypothetical protein n=1 Tax=Mycobacterium marinum TaxID=1781 RepID=UPI00040073E2|nr:hypothetical protein [Mycobacterium marinum]AXN45017.1 hypothetical protein MM1218R_03081 [Mycobacterium marinum]AXN50355.1 hypothetical protein CCUG20998_02950 [Mycobacterium marinum]RFZ01464.1 hypothetical protein VIMS_05710 [Mycobacterium marinum]RFZ02523.1 hypothetical protein DSM43518_05008 [Mycobacterium marinum]RFZ10311.1 hypothetical protein DE4381_01803 [Mycobacterium marinum]